MSDDPHHKHTFEKVKREPAKGIGDAWRRLVNDIKARFGEGIDVANAEWMKDKHHHHGDGKACSGDHHHHCDHSSTKKTLDAHKPNLPKENGGKGKWSYRAINKPGKTGIIIGATASLGVALHGGVNMIRGGKGHKDETLQEEKPASATTFLVGAAETIGGLALVKKALTGRVRF